MRKAVLVVPPNDYAANLNTLQIASLLAPPLGALSLGTYLQSAGVPVELVDVQVDCGLGLTPEADLALAQRVAEHLAAQADEIGWVGISCLSNATTGLTLGQEIARLLPDVPIILGGYFPSTNYALLLERFPFITAVVRGDVAAVKAAVEAGVRNAGKVGEVVASHVIARPHVNVDLVLPLGRLDEAKAEAGQG